MKSNANVQIERFDFLFMNIKLEWLAKKGKHNVFYLSLKRITNEFPKHVKLNIFNYFVFIENRLVVIAGENYGSISSIELINERKDLKCNIPPFPYGVSLPSATILPTGILVCGGKNRGGLNKCYKYEKLTSSWLPFPSMDYFRHEIPQPWYLGYGWIWKIQI